MFSLIVIAGAIAYYFLHKTTKIALVYISGRHNGFAFKRSIIEEKISMRLQRDE